MLVALYLYPTPHKLVALNISIPNYPYVGCSIHKIFISNSPYAGGCVYEISAPNPHMLIGYAIYDVVFTNLSTII